MVHYLVQCWPATDNHYDLPSPLTMLWSGKQNKVKKTAEISHELLESRWPKIGQGHGYFQSYLTPGQPL